MRCANNRDRQGRLTRQRGKAGTPFVRGVEILPLLQRLEHVGLLVVRQREVAAWWTLRLLPVKLFM